TPIIGALSLSDPASSPPRSSQAPESFATTQIPTRNPGHQALDRLRKYANVEPGAFASLDSALESPHISLLLAHLPASAAADPATYNWRALETEAITSATDNPSPKARRKAERAKRRTQVQAWNLATSVGTRDQAPLVGSSQIVLP